MNKRGLGNYCILVSTPTANNGIAFETGEMAPYTITSIERNPGHFNLANTMKNDFFARKMKN